MIKKTTIGRIDELSLPEFGLEDLQCKIDTGAALSSIHCQNVKVVQSNGVDELHFKLLDKKHPNYHKKYYKTTEFRERNIKNSFGQEQTRYSFVTTVKLFDREIQCEFTLADREKMTYPCLLGRNLLRQGFIVDVRKKNLSAKHKNKNQ